ncbi:hypothetical protein BH24PSE2_BH24PSE2_00350 [soil metagenome]
MTTRHGRRPGKHGGIPAIATSSRRSEPDRRAPSEGPLLIGRDMDPAKVLSTVRALGGACEPILLVACEPQTFGDELDGRMGLSEPVAQAVDEAVVLVESLLDEWPAMVA